MPTSAEQERAAVVAWLRKAVPSNSASKTSHLIGALAEAIERGLHHGGEG